MKYLGISIAYILFICSSMAQQANTTTTEKDAIGTSSQMLQGVIVDDKKEPLLGVNVYWLASQVSTSTDDKGYFIIPRIKESSRLIVSYVGYKNDTLNIADQEMVEIQLADHIELEEIVISHKKSGLTYSYLSPIRIQEINKDELLHAACCNLSESFETNATVNAAPTDAVTGTRQIKMLGLAGPYMQITRENMPDTRGLSSLQGLLYTPGSWVDAIQINTGVGSVTNGYEALTGQINVELVKPEDTDPIYFNLYRNEAGRSEMNVNLSKKMTDAWSSALLLHGLYQGRQTDVNQDGFLDNPLSKRFIILNRHRFLGANGWGGQVGVRYVNSENESGQFDSGETVPWKGELNNQHLTFWAKAGKVFTNTNSMGIQFATSWQDQKSSYGLRNFDATHLNVYGNLIFQGILFYSTVHKYKAGASFQLDHFDESVNNTEYNRREAVPGIFGEYSYQPSGQFSLTAGLRGDHHSNYGFFVTPRLHLRYAPQEQTVLRFATGRGLRTANIFADNVALFATNREIRIQESQAGNPYGLQPEIAWTMGFSISQQLNISSREIGLEFDAYRTSFQDQVIVDYDASPQGVSFYNLHGSSFANNLQLSLSTQIHDLVELRMAYRLSDVQVDYQQERLQQPYTPRHRAFANLRYEDDGGWAINYTLNWVGAMRLPNTLGNPIDKQMPAQSQHYTLSNLQVSKTWNQIFDLYIGAENLFGFRQEMAIIDAANPFSEYFDASMIWAPIFGRNLYAGVRWRLKK